MNESRTSSSSRRSRKIHGYGLQYDDDAEEDQITYTSAAGNKGESNKKGAGFKKTYLPQALNAEPLLED